MFEGIDPEEKPTEKQRVAMYKKQIPKFLLMAKGLMYCSLNLRTLEIEPLVSCNLKETFDPH